MNYSNSNLDTLGYGDGKVSMDDTIGCDGEVVHYEAATNGIQNLGNRNEDFMSADGEPEDDFYNAGGLFKNFRKNQKMRQQRRNERNKSKNRARGMRGTTTIGRSEAKKGLAKAQQMAAKASEKAVAGDVALANAMASNAPQADAPQGMSKGLKIGLIVGGVVVLGIVGFVVYKKFIQKK